MAGTKVFPRSRSCRIGFELPKEHGIEGMNTQKTNTPEASQSQSQRRLGSRAALLAGFGALLVLMVLICVDALHTLAAFETNDTQIRHDFIYR